MITNWLRKEYIQLGVKADTVEEVIRKSAQPLVDENKIKVEYVDDILQNLKEAGPYFVLMPEVAIPHAQAQDNVIENALGLTVLENPIEFKSSNDPVKFVFTLAANKGDSHLEALSTLAVLFEDETFFDLLRTASNPDQIIEYIQTK